MLDNIWELAVVRTCLLGAARDRGSLLWLLPDSTADGPMQRIFHYVVDEWRSQATSNTHISQLSSVAGRTA